MGNRALVLVEIDSDGDRCGSCAHRRNFYRRPLAPIPKDHQACKLFGGIVREGRRVAACLRAQVDVAEDPEPRVDPHATELAS